MFGVTFGVPNGMNQNEKLWVAADGQIVETFDFVK